MSKANVGDRVVITSPSLHVGRTGVVKQVLSSGPALLRMDDTGSSLWFADSEFDVVSDERLTDAQTEAEDFLEDVLSSAQDFADAVTAEAVELVTFVADSARTAVKRTAPGLVDFLADSAKSFIGRL